MNRTQQGNNNAYCQDNEISWFDWTLLEKNQELFRFCKNLIAFRRKNPVFRRNTFFNGGTSPDTADAVWFSPEGVGVDWNGAENTLACRIHPRENSGTGIYMFFNATDHPVTFQLPEGAWRVRINSAAPPPEDYFEHRNAPPAQGDAFEASAKSVVVLTTSE